MKHIRLIACTDLHQTKWLYNALEEAVAKHKPDVVALVGDFLHGGDLTSKHYSIEECAERLAAFPCEVLFTRGNHEMENWNPFVDRWIELGKPLHIPHGDGVSFGPLVIVGFPSTFLGEESFLMSRANNTFDNLEWIPAALRKYGRAARTLWLLHEPPSGTRLCAPEGFMEGVREWREAIEDYSPWITISGHDHETPVLPPGYWHDRIESTVCINAGQPVRLTHKTKTLHYCVLDFNFLGDEPSLPENVTIKAFPWKDTIRLP